MNLQQDGDGQGRHLVIIAHPDDELVFMSPAMLGIMRGPQPIKIVYLTAGDAAKDEPYWRAREQAIAQTHVMLRQARAAPIAREFLRLADGMLQGEGAPRHGGQSLIKLWHGDITQMHALDTRAPSTRETLIARLHATIDAFAPTLVHTLNGVVKDPHEHADHHATGLFAAAAAKRWSQRVPVRFYVGSNSPRLPANVTGSTLADKIAVFASYAQHDAEIFTGRADWLTASIYAPMLEREYFTACNNDDMRIEGDAIAW